MCLKPPFKYSGGSVMLWASFGLSKAYEVANSCDQCMNFFSKKMMDSSKFSGKAFSWKLLQTSLTGGAHQCGGMSSITKSMAFSVFQQFWHPNELEMTEEV